MFATVPAEPANQADVPSSRRRLLIDVSTARTGCVVRVAGELDLSTRNEFVSAATACEHPNTTIDLSDVTFMDCSGYSALVAARRYIEGGGGVLTIVGQVGQPARLLDLIVELESCPLRPALNHRSASPHHISSNCRENSVGVSVAIHK